MDVVASYQDITRFVEELGSESDRGLPLIAAAFIDDRLAETLRAFFRPIRSATKLLDLGTSPLASFSARSDACHALGLIDGFEHNEIVLIRKIRNEFAHGKHVISFQTPRIRDLCSNLKYEKPTDEGYSTNNPRRRLYISAVAISIRLYHRPLSVASQRRQAQDWSNRNAAK